MVKIKIREFRTLEEGILILQEEARAGPISIEEILHILSNKGRPLILILLSLPFCQPIQIPGFSIPFGLVIAFIGLRMSLGKHAWLPKKLREKKVPTETIMNITKKTLVVVEKMKPWIHPRMIWMCHSPFMEVMHGLLIFALGMCLALPLPVPASNMAVAWPILFLSFGILKDDGLFVTIGYILSLFTFAFFIAVALSVGKFVTHSFQ